MTAATPSLDRLCLRYLQAKAYVISNGYAAEVDWQEARDPEEVGDQDFLAQAAWVVMSSGLSASAVERSFPEVTAAFQDWHAVKIARRSEECLAAGLQVFRNERKLVAILEFASLVASGGRGGLIARIGEVGPDALLYLPFMGPATSRHLAKSLGFDIAKPDRHLVRIAAATGATSPQALCSDIGARLGERTAVVDLVLWRFATLRRDYVSYFRLVRRGTAGAHRAT